MGAEPRLTLRTLVAADAAAYAEAAGEEPGAHGALSASLWPFDAAAEIAVWEPDPARVAFVVEEGGRLVGIVAMQESPPGEVEISYWVRGTERGRGVATAALRLAGALVEELGGRPWLEIDPWNAASLRVAAKAGYIEDGEIGERLRLVRPH